MGRFLAVDSHSLQLQSSVSAAILVSTSDVNLFAADSMPCMHVCFMGMIAINFADVGVPEKKYDIQLLYEPKKRSWNAKFAVTHDLNALKKVSLPHTQRNKYYILNYYVAFTG